MALRLLWATSLHLRVQLLPRDHASISLRNKVWVDLCGDYCRIVSTCACQRAHKIAKEIFPMNRMRLRASRMTLALFLLLAAGVFSYAQTATPAADGWVVLPVSEYMALKNAASPAEPEPAAPPVE